MKKNIAYTACLLIFNFSVYAGPIAITGSATVTASSELNSSYSAKHVIDGVIAIEGKGEWLSKGNDLPWITLTWKNPQSVNRIVLYHASQIKNRITKGKLLFSDGTTMEVDIPVSESVKSIEFPAKQTSSIKFIAISGLGINMGLSEIEVFPSPKQYPDYVSWVDPFIETNKGRYFFFITGSRPYGMVTAAPMTINRNGGGGYTYKELNIKCFPQVHSWTLSGIGIMPTLANVNPTQGEAAWKSPFSHDDEIAQPGYHRVFLQKPGVWAEETATERVSFYRFTWTEDTMAQILTILSGRIGSTLMAKAAIQKNSDYEFQGSVSSVKRAYNSGPIDIKIFFVIQFDKPFISFDGWRAKNLLKGINTIEGDSIGVAPVFKVKAGEYLQMKIAISYTSVENAKKNLQAECTTWNFDQVWKETKKIWNEWLGKIEVKSSKDAYKIKFYTDLWHVLLGRQIINDVTGDYPDRTEGKRLVDRGMTDAVFKIKTLPKNADGTSKFNMYNSDAFWITRWNLNVLWGLAWPGVEDDIAASLVQYAENGGLLPRGPAGGGYSYIMSGCPATSLIVSAFMKGILTKTNPENAFQLIKKNHLPGGMLGDAEHKPDSGELEFYINKGWWPDNAGITIESSFEDWGAAQMARKLKKIDDYNYFRKRSTSWENSFEPNQKMILPKDREGVFNQTDLLSGKGFVEANSWQATFGVSQDIPGLSKLMGGNDTLCKKLNYAFENSRKSDFVYNYNAGYVSYANEPGCSNAHVFSYVGAPWLTQYWVRRVKEQAYGGTTPDLGYGGHDEDEGQMGGVSALMAIGLFNIVGNESVKPFYEITSPIFNEVIIHLDPKYYPGKTFIIKTYNNSKKNCYIQKATLNGKVLDNFWFSFNDFKKGGILELWLGNQPNKHWGIAKFPPVN